MPTRHNKYTIEDVVDKMPKHSYWRPIGFGLTESGRVTKIVCKCKCGTVKSIAQSSVINGDSVSCGCYKSEYIKSNRLTIEQINQKKPEYSLLRAIKYDEQYNDTHKDKSKTKVICQCECGKIISTYSYDVRKGKSLSCGCHNIEMIKKRRTKYQGSQRGVYGSYKNMISRCYNEKNKAYKNYGGRGVRVCDEWLNDYNNFLSWSLQNGWEAGLQIDKDIKGNGLLYSPDTCCWVTNQENNTFRINEYRTRCKLLQQKSVT